MLFLMIFGALIVLLGVFYAVQQWREYREWKASAIILLLGVAMLGYGAMNWHGIKQTRQPEQAQNTPANQRASINEDGGTAGVFKRNDKATVEQQQMTMLRQLQKSFNKFGTVDFDESSKTYQIKPTDDNSKKAIDYLNQHHDAAKQIGWDKITDSVLNISKQLKKAMGPGYSVSIMSSDGNTTMYTAKDGQETLNVANQ